MSAIQGLIFDKDGTLFDFGATWEAWANAFLLRLCGGDRVKAADVGFAIGYDLEGECFDRNSIVIAGTPGEVTDALLPHFEGWSATDLEAVLNEEAAMAPQKPAVALAPLLLRYFLRLRKLFTV